MQLKLWWANLLYATVSFHKQSQINWFSTCLNMKHHKDVLIIAGSSILNAKFCLFSFVRWSLYCFIWSIKFWNSLNFQSVSPSFKSFRDTFHWCSLEIGYFLNGKMKIPLALAKRKKRKYFYFSCFMKI